MQLRLRRCRVSCVQLRAHTIDLAAHRCDALAVWVILTQSFSSTYPLYREREDRGEGLRSWLRCQ